MAAKPTHDLAVKTGEYTDRNTGEQKGRWLKIGTVFRHDDGGVSIKLDALPVGLAGWEGWVSVFLRREPGQGRQASQPQQHHSGNGGQQSFHAQAPDGFDDDIPF